MYGMFSTEGEAAVEAALAPWLADIAKLRSWGGVPTEAYLAQAVHGVQQAVAAQGFREVHDTAVRDELWFAVEAAPAFDREAAMTRALGVGPGETLRIEMPEEEAPIQTGDRVLVPAPHKPRNAQREYHPGSVQGESMGILTVKLDNGRTVHVARGIVAREESA